MQPSLHEGVRDYAGMFPIDRAVEDWLKNGVNGRSPTGMPRDIPTALLLIFSLTEGVKIQITFWLPIRQQQPLHKPVTMIRV